ncbi:MAG TPA: rRNA maturation RNAse YbeY, partial [Candidatus Limadaptatus stercoravium]|nr:rRNA maturation RNAse YbeY [Candidatus Limadaptatus stercoravium]
MSDHDARPLRHQDDHHRNTAAGTARQSVVREEEVMIEFTGANFRERRLVRRVEKAVYSVLGQRDIFTVDLAVTDGATVRAYNRETRGVDAETDVLSFPYFEGLKLPVTENDFSDEAFDGKRVALGSIMI